jgi:coenzyme F420-0:L-glutamate ligase/coenzyme F420-1:gamma-L-glutamate ligase
MDGLMAKRLEIVAPEHFPLVEPGDFLPRQILDTLQQEQFPLQSGDVIVLAQKIVSKSENRLVDVADVEPSPDALEWAQKCDKDPRLVQLILDESSEVLRCVPGVLIVRHRLGFVMANAGIDHSNVSGSAEGQRVLLLPEDPDRSARKLQAQLSQITGLDLAVIISDSFGRPWRLGTTGVCIGCAGIASLLDRRGDLDLFGQELKVTQVAVGDELATAASILMGQTNEARPLVIIRGVEFPLEPAPAQHLLRPAEEDLFL